MEKDRRRWRAFLIVLAAEAAVLLASARAEAEPGMPGVVLVNRYTPENPGPLIQRIESLRRR